MKPPYAKKWWDKRHNVKLQQAKERDIELLMIGDSITHSWEKKGAEVWQQYYQPRKAFNLGFSGDRTEHVLWRLQNGALDNLSPKLTVLMIGTNNTGHRMDPAQQTAGGIQSMLNEIRGRLPESKVLLLAIFPRHESPYNEMRLRNDEINRLIAEFADGEHIYYLNVNHVFLDAEGKLKQELMPDLLHPNALGYQAWAQAMEPTIRQLMH